MSLGGLFSGQAFETTLEPDIDIRDVLDQRLFMGAGPVTFTNQQAKLKMASKAYIDEVISSDLARLGNEPRRDQFGCGSCSSLSRHVGTEVQYTAIAGDISATTPIAPETVVEYLNTLQETVSPGISRCMGAAHSLALRCTY